jgi:hypothetical protein
MGSPRVYCIRVYGKVQWPIDMFEHVVHVVSGGCPSAAWLARVFARSLANEWLCALILPRCVRMPESQRVLRVCVMERSVYLGECCKGRRKGNSCNLVQGGGGYGRVGGLCRCPLIPRD